MGNEISYRGRECWRVGILFSQSGVTSVTEKSQLHGTLLAIEEINESGGVDGVPIEPVVYDPASVVSRYGDLAETLLSKDGVNVIFGCYMSSTRKEVLPIIERRNALLFYPTLYEGFEYSANVIYGGAAPNQNSVPLASYLLETYGDRFYFIGSDYIYPRESNRVMRNILRQWGGEVVGERYVPLDVGKDAFNAILQDVKRKSPDVIFSTVVGTGTIYLYRAYQDCGRHGRKCPIASLTTNEAEIAQMGSDAAFGHITAAPYFRSIKTNSNKRFLDLYKARFGSVDDVTFGSEAAYFQVHMFANALELVGTLDTDNLRLVLHDAEFDAPQGRVKIDADNNHTYLHSRVGKVDKSGEYGLELEVTRPIKPDPYLVNPALNDWSLHVTSPKKIDIPI